MWHNKVFSICVLFACLYGVVGELLLSAHVQWAPLNHSAVRFRYHLSWEQTQVRLCPIPNTDVKCSAYLGGSFPVTLKILGKWLGGYNWECDGGCVPAPRTVSNLSEMVYKNISTYRQLPWESGTETMDIDLSHASKEETISLRFYRPDGMPMSYIGPAHFTMATRQDTSRPNIGPIVSPLPFYHIPLGVEYRIVLYPYDGDGDRVRCKWETHINATSIRLDQEKCTIGISTKSQSGYRLGRKIRLALYAEDYRCLPIRIGTNLTTGPFSRSPFTITLIIGETIKNNTPTVETRPDDVNDRPNPVALLRLPIKNFKTSFDVHSDHARDYLSTGPRFMQFYRQPNTTSVQAIWNVPVDANMTGIHQACVLFYTQHGMPYPKPRCKIFFVGGVDKCRGNPCLGSGLCRSWYNHHTCVTTEDSDSCHHDGGVYDFLKDYLRYLLYAGAGVLGLLFILLLICLVQRCCCDGKRNRPRKNNRPVPSNGQPPTSTQVAW